MRSIDLHCIQRGPCKWLPAWTTVCYTVVTSTYLPKRGHMAPGTVASSRCSNRERSFTSMHSHLVALSPSAYTTPLCVTWPVYALPAWTTVCYTVVTSTHLPQRGEPASDPSNRPHRRPSSTQRVPCCSDHQGPADSRGTPAGPRAPGRTPHRRLHRRPSSRDRAPGSIARGTTTGVTSRHPQPPEHRAGIPPYQCEFLVLSLLEKNV